VVLGFITFVIALLLQLRVRKYIPWVYWLAAAMVAVFGTMAADVIHVVLGVPYILSAVFFFMLLIMIFSMWYKTEKTLSIHSIYSSRREIFYWSTVVVTFALGTATGDLTATTLGLGYLISGILFAGLIAIPAIAYLVFGVNEVLTFWVAYILTRPLGASFADWIGKPASAGGLGIGTGLLSLFLFILMSLCVVYISVSKKEKKMERGN